MRKLLGQMALLMAIVATTVPVNAQLEGTVPDLNQAIGGSVNTTTYGLDVNVNGGKGAVGQFDWNSFNVGSDKRVNFGFSNYSQTALNRVLGNDPSQIYGQLTQSSLSATKDYGSTGKVILINPNGIMFGEGSKVNLNSFTASTFDAQNAKNLKDLSVKELATYKSNLKNYFGDGITINFSGADSKIGALIKADKAKLNIDKTLILMGKDIEITNGSELTTNLDYNYGSPANQSFSNIKLIAGNGAKAKYQLNGYVMNEDLTTNAALSGVESDITIGSTNSTDGTCIESGNIFIKNKGETYDKTSTGGTDGSNIKIQNSYILGNKLINNEYGNIDIVSNNYVDVNNSWIKTFNTYEEGNQASKNTYAQNGGNILINGGSGVGIQGSTIQSAYSTQDQTSGNIDLISGYGNVKVNKTDILSRGNVNIDAKLNSNVTNSLVIASNPSTSFLKNITIKGSNEVNVGNSLLDASKNISIASDKGINIYKNDAKANGTRSILYAGENISLDGADTSIADTNLSYKNLSLYGAKDNNITVKNTTTFEDRTNSDLTLDVHGNLKLDNATMKKAVVAENSKNTSVGSASTQSKITLNSTKNISIDNTSDVQSDSDININAKSGSFELLGKSKLNSTGDTNINTLKTFAAETGGNMESDDAIIAKNINITVTGSDADIILSQPVYNKMTYTGKLNLNAGRNIEVTSGDIADGNVTLKNANLVAKAGTNTLTATNDLSLNNVSLKSSNNTIKANKGSVSLGLNVESNTTKTENTVTTVEAAKDIKGNVNLNQTKLYANASKDVDLNLTKVSNANAGVEVSGSNVTLNATDDKLSISRIVANKLNLDKNDKFIAAKTTLTATDISGLDQPAQGTDPETVEGDATGRAYIEVKDFGGFNLDTTAYSIDEDGHYVGFYTASYLPTTYTDGSGEALDAYAKHFVNLPGESSEQPFLLVYTKLDNSQQDGPPVVDPDYTNNEEANVSNIIRIPSPSEIYGLPEPINNALTSATTNIVAAAAGITFGNDDENSNEYIKIITNK